MHLNQTHQRTNLISSCILLMVVLAFAVKALLPAGFMPETKGGFTKLVICSGMGEKTILVPNDEQQPSSDHEESKSDKVCAYQVLASGKILVPVPVVLLPITVLEQTSVTLADDGFVFSTTSIPFEARGPPLV